MPATAPARVARIWQIPFWIASLGDAVYSFAKPWIEANVGDAAIAFPSHDGDR